MKSYREMFDELIESKEPRSEHNHEEVIDQIREIMVLADTEHVLNQVAKVHITEISEVNRILRKRYNILLAATILSLIALASPYFGG